MAFCLKITKKGEARYAQIVETFYDPKAKRSNSRSIESFGDLNKQLALDPAFESKLRLRIQMLNQEEPQLSVEQVLYPSLTQPEPKKDGLLPLTFGFVLERVLWEELDLRGLLVRLANNCDHSLGDKLDFISFFLMELKFNPLGFSQRPLEYRQHTILDFSSITAEEFISGLTFLGKRKNTILRHIRNQLLRFDQAAQSALMSQTTPESQALFDENRTTKTIRTKAAQYQAAKAPAISTQVASQSLTPDSVASSTQIDALHNTTSVLDQSQSKPMQNMQSMPAAQTIPHTKGTPSVTGHPTADGTPVGSRRLGKGALGSNAGAGAAKENSGARAKTSVKAGEGAASEPNANENIAAIPTNLFQALALAVKTTSIQRSHKSLHELQNEMDNVAPAKPDLGSLQPFLGTTGFYDVRSIYIEGPQPQGFKQQIVLGVLMTCDGIPLDYDYLYKGRTNYFRAAANLKHMVTSLNEFCQFFGWTKLIMRVDHTYDISQLILALSELNCEYMLCQNADGLSVELQQQLLQSESWQSLKRESSTPIYSTGLLFEQDESSLKSAQASNAATPAITSAVATSLSDHFSNPASAAGSNAVSTLTSGTVATSGNPDSDLASAALEPGHKLARVASKLTAASELHGVHDYQKASLPEANAGHGLHASKEHKSHMDTKGAPDYKFQRFQLQSAAKALPLKACALWSQRRTNAEKHMWALSQTMRFNYLNIAGSCVRAIREQRADAFLDLLGNYNASAPTDFELLHSFEHILAQGGELEEAELQLMQQIKENFLSGTILFVSSGQAEFEPEQLTALMNNLSDWECIILQFYSKILTPWDWSQLNKIAKRPSKLPTVDISHYQGQIAVCFLAWMLEQWRSFRLYNLNVQCTEQTLQRSLDLLSLVRWNVGPDSYWLKLNTERIEQPELAWSELQRIFEHFHLTLPAMPEKDEGLIRKLHLKLPLSQA